jgi:hypothetical protein
VEVIIKGKPKEIADLVLAVQSRQTERESPIKFLEDAYRSAIYDIAEEEQKEGHNAPHTLHT